MKMILGFEDDGIGKGGGDGRRRSEDGEGNKKAGRERGREFGWDIVVEGTN